MHLVRHSMAGMGDGWRSQCVALLPKRLQKIGGLPMWRFWKWPRPPTDPLVAMALPVRGVERECGDWQEIVIRKRIGHPDGGVEMAVR